MTSLMIEAARRGAERPLRVGVVGAGVMGSNHARVLAELPGVRLVGVADVERAQAQCVASILGCGAFDSTAALIASVVYLSL